MVSYIAIYIFLFLFFLWQSKRKFSRWINLISIFTGLWCITGIVSSFGFFGLRIPSSQVHIYTVAFVAIFDLVFLLFAKKDKTFSVRIMDGNSEYTAYEGKDSRGVDSLQIVVLLLSSVLLVKMTRVLFVEKSLTAVRDLYFGSGSFSSVYLDLIFRMLPIGMLYGLVIYNSYLSLKFGEKKYLVWAIIDTVVITLTGGGRYGILLFIYTMTMIIISEPRDAKGFYRKKYNKSLRAFIILSVILIILVTISRGQAFVKTIVTYFAGSFSFLDYILQNPTAFALNDKLYGYMFFGGIIEPIVLILKVLGLTSIKVPQWYFNINCQQFYRITTSGDPIYINNNTTIIYYLLRDFGAVGIIIGAVVLAIILVYLYNKLDSNNDFCILCYLYFAYVMFNTVMTYSFFGTNPAFVLIALYLCTRRKRIKFIIKR